MLARLFTDGVGDKGFNGDDTLGENMWRYGVATGDTGSAVGTGSSLVDSKESVEMLTGVKGPSAVGIMLLAVSRKAADATSALRAVDDRPCCCRPSSSPLELLPSRGRVAALGNGDIFESLS